MDEGWYKKGGIIVTECVTIQRPDFPFVLSLSKDEWKILLS